MLLGSSHIQGLNLGALTPECSGYGILNFGIGFDTTEGLLSRLSDYNSLNKANLTVLQIGGNDLFSKKASHDTDALLGRFTKIGTRLSKVRKLVWVGVFPVRDNLNRSYRSELVTKANTHIEGLCLKMKNCKYLAPEIFIIEKPGEKSSYVEDGIHLTTESYLRWTDELRKHMDSEIQQNQVAVDGKDPES